MHEIKKCEFEIPTTILWHTQKCHSIGAITFYHQKRFTAVILNVFESIWIVPKNLLFPLHFLSICFGSSSRRRSERYFKGTPETSPKRKKNKCAVSLWCVNGMLNKNEKRKKFTSKIFWLAIRHLNAFSLLMLDLIYLLLLILQLAEYYVGFHNHRRRWEDGKNALMFVGNFKCKIIYKGFMFFPVAIALKALNNLIKKI